MNHEPLCLVGGGADSEAVRYACGFTAPDPFIYLKKGSDHHVVVSALELGRARRNPVPLRCHSAESLGISGKARRELAAQAGALLDELGNRRVWVSSDCPAGLVRGLEKDGFKVVLRKSPLFPERALKTKEELRFLRQAQRAAVSAMKLAMGLIADSRPGSGGELRDAEGRVLSSEQVRARIQQHLLGLGFQAEEVIVAGGDQAADPHERGRGALRAGEWIVLDIFPRSMESGYWGDITRTVMKGKPSPERKRLYQTVLRAQRAALKQVAPGVSGAEIHAGIVEAFTEAGYKTEVRNGFPEGFIHSTGHGVGLDIHEAPSVSPAGGPLQPGHVITIEPGLYYRGLGGVRIEDAVEVTETGGRVLAGCSKQGAV